MREPFERMLRTVRTSLARQLADQTSPIMLYDVSLMADRTARREGRKTDLFDSLYDYEALLPEGWGCAWLSASDSPTADSILYCTPPGWREGQDRSDSLLLGGGILRHVPRDMADD